MKRELPFSNPCLEGLEPRLLLSTSGLAGPEVLGAPENSCANPDSAVWVGDLTPHAIDLAKGTPSEEKDEGDPIISPMLEEMRERIGALQGADPQADLAAVSPSPYIARITSAGLIQIYVHVEDVTPALEDALAAAGLDVELSRADMRLLQGWVDYRALDAIAAVPDVRSLSLPSYGIPNAGDYTTAGDTILKAADLRTACDVTGDGVKVGVISNGIDNWDKAELTGDLPETITYTDDGQGDEGTAMLEIVHDLAPDADLYFAPADTSAAMVSAIEWLTGQNVDVIVDDLTFYLSGESYFTDGPSTSVASAAQDAVDEDGIVYVTCAGNWQRQYDGYAREDEKSHWQGQFTDSDSDGYHEFAQADEGNFLYVLDDETLYVNLQWSDPWPGSDNDYDLFLYDDSVQEIASSELAQTGTQYPWEGLSWKNTTGSTQRVHLLIEQFSGESRELEVFTYQTFGTALEYATGDALASQQAVESVISVGAISATDQGHDTVEPDSSHGPSTIYTDLTDNQVSSERESLDICGISHVDTSIGHTEHFPNPFTGTSAAAPHIAGIAALLLEIDPTLTPADIQDLITDNAVDIGDGGYDHVSGWGRADAVATVTAAATAADLKAATDTGTSDTDDLTKLDNSAGGKELQFDVTGTISGATVTIYAGEIEIGTAVASGATTTVTTNGTHDLSDTGHSITARQTETDKLESPATSALTVTVDTVAPTVNIEDVSPDPRGTAVTDSLDITFSEAIDHTEFTLADLGLTRDGYAVSLATADLTDSGNHYDWTLDDLDDLTDKVGKYELTLTASGSGIIDVAGNDLAAPADDEWLMHTINGTGGNDTISLAWNDGTSRTDVVVGETEYAINPANLTVLYVEALAGDDELTVDFADGDPLPSGGLDYDGGDGADTLRIDGSTSADTVSSTTTQATVNSSEIDHTGVESLVLALDGGANAVDVEGGFGVDDLTILGGGSGTYTFEADDPDDTGDLELTIEADAEVTIETSLRLEALTLNDASLVTLTGTGLFIHTDALSMEESGGSPTATLDLTDNNLIVDYDGTSSFSDIQHWIREGCNGGGWDGTGITSSEAASQSITALGVIDNADTEPGIGGLPDLEGEDLDDDYTSILVKYTYYGDANLDGIVDSNDYDRIDTNYQLWIREQKVPDGGWRWAVGDFSYDNWLDSNDYDLIDNAYTQQGGAL